MIRIDDNVSQRFLALFSLRLPSLMTLLFAVCYQAQAFRETPIGLPTTITCYDERGGRRVIGGTCIMVSEGGDKYLPPTNATPFQFQGSFRSVERVKLSVDGNYVFVSGGRDGLYRCDIQNHSWKSIRPEGARASSPAIAVGPDGTLYAGMGMSSYTVSYTGLYRSTDNGESWTEMELRYDSSKVSPSVLDVVVSSGGRLFIKASLAPGGVNGSSYEILPNGTLVRITSGDLLVHNEIVSSYTTAYVRFGSRPGDNSTPKIFTVSGDTVIRKAVAWPNDDTLLVVVEHRGQYTALLLLDGRIIRSIDLGVCVGQFRPWITSSYYEGRKSIICSGLGRNYRLYLDNSEFASLEFPTEYPIVDDVLCTRDWGLVLVWRHGWYRFTSSGISRYDSAVTRQFNTRLLNRSMLSRRMIMTDYNNRIVEVTSSGIDTLISIPFPGVINSADVNEEKNELYWALDHTLVRTDLKTKESETLTANGWPYTQTGAFRQPFSLSGVSAFGTRILAWASTSSIAPETRAREGLYEYVNSAWKFVLGSTIGPRTRVIASARNDSTIVFAVAEDLGSLGYSAPSIVMMRTLDSVALLCPVGDAILTNESRIATLDRGALITTIMDKLYRTVPESLPDEIDLGTKVLEAVEMDRYIAVSSESRGVFLIPKTDLVTTVEYEPVSTSNAEHTEVYPNPVAPGQALTICLPKCCIQPKVTLVDLIGRSAGPDLVDYTACQSGIGLTIASWLPPGCYIIHIAGQACEHSLTIQVRW